MPSKAYLLLECVGQLRPMRVPLQLLVQYKQSAVVI